MAARADDAETGRPPSATSDGRAGKRTLCCSFCFKSQHEVPS
jgi:hypothetical protein